jgi:hypothetical protein
MKASVLLCVLLCLSLHAACGGTRGSGAADPSPGTTPALSGSEYVTIDNEQLVSAAGQLSGKGVVAFRSPLGGIATNKNFKLTVSLDDGGFCELRTHATNTLGAAVVIGISRRGDSLFMYHFIGEGRRSEREIKSLAAGDELSLSIDVHNTESPAHVLVWSAREELPTDDNAIFNSDADASSVGNGAGAFWGISFAGAAVKEAKVGPALFSH